MSLSVQIEKRLGDFRLDVSFDAGDECFGMLGASGCGKSVTLRCIAGILKPDRGRIVMDGRVLFDSEQGIDLKPRERRVGYLFQQYALFPNMSVRENIEAAARGVRRERRAAADRLLRKFRIEEIAELKPGQISGGQKQRAALARILAAEPSLICLDEPFSALDSFLRRRLELGLSEMLSEFSGTVLWVSHDRGEVYRNCDRVCVMDRGKSLETAPVKELFAAPKTEAAARLAGFRNFAEAFISGKEAPGAGSAEGAAVGAESGMRVVIPSWGLAFSRTGPFPERFRKAGIGARSLRPAESIGEKGRKPEEEKNREIRFRCSVAREIEEEDCMTVLLCPEKAAEGAELLCMELPKDAWEETKRRYGGVPAALEVTVSPEKILLLR